MRNLILVTIIILTFINCADEKDCTEFRTGEFMYIDKNMPERIIRNDSVQIEINPKTGVEVYASIQWISDCQYTLTFEKILNHPNDVEYMIGNKIYVDVISTNKDKYSVYVKMGDNRKLLEFKKVR